MLELGLSHSEDLVILALIRLVTIPACESHGVTDGQTGGNALNP